MENLSTVNAEPEQIVDAQTATTEESVNAESGEVATPQEVEKPIQTPEQNAEFARLRRETEAKAKDALIAEMYGESHGIKTYSEYQKALAEQKAQEEIEALTTTLPKELAEELYQLRQERIERQKQAELQTQEQKRAEENLAFLDFWKQVNGKEWTQEDGLPEEVAKLNESGVPLKFAYSEYMAKRMADEKRIDKINTENAESSTGSVTGKGASVEKEFYTPDEVDNLTKRDLDNPKIMAKVMASMTKW